MKDEAFKNVFGDDSVEKPDSIEIRRTAKGKATWTIKIRSKDLTEEKNQKEVIETHQKIWNELKKQFPT